jgi:hypothetical protein
MAQDAGKPILSVQHPGTEAVTLHVDESKASDQSYKMTEPRVFFLLAFWKDQKLLMRSVHASVTGLSPTSALLDTDEQ